MCFLHQYSISFLAISHACDDAHSARSDAGAFAVCIAVLQRSLFDCLNWFIIQDSNRFVLYYFETRFLHQYSISFLAISHACDNAHSSRSDVNISSLITFLSTLIDFLIFYFFILITCAILQTEAFDEAIATEMRLVWGIRRSDWELRRRMIGASRRVLNTCSFGETMPILCYRYWAGNTGECECQGIGGGRGTQGAHSAGIDIEFSADAVRIPSYILRQQWFIRYWQQWRCGWRGDQDKTSNTWINVYWSHMRMFAWQFKRPFFATNPRWQRGTWLRCRDMRLMTFGFWENKSIYRYRRNVGIRN
jgi:hypothetical protein